MNRDVLFYEPEDSFGFLSNFAPYTVEFEQRVWPTSEHCYQASKFTDTKIISLIHQAETAEVAFQLSREFQHQIREDWLQIRYQRMYEIVRAKFNQHKRLAHLLVATQDRTIKEHSHTDDYWGDGGDDHGENKLGEILMIIRDQLKQSPAIKCLQYVESSSLPTQWGSFTMYGFIEPKSGQEHLALTFGKWSEQDVVLARIHSECLTGEAFTSLRCDCGPQLQQAMAAIAKHGAGVLVYLRQEGRGIGLLNKIKAYRLQDRGVDTVEANHLLGFETDLRKYDICQVIFEFLNINSIDLMTNNPEKIAAVEKMGVTVNKRIEMKLTVNDHNRSYLLTKQEKMGHLLNKYDIF